MARACYRNVDKPILVFGLEYQDWAVVLVCFCVFALVPWISNLTVLMLTVICATILRVLKASKPRGYLLHLLYRGGLPLPGLLPPPRTIAHYSAFPKVSSGIVHRRKDRDPVCRLLAESGGTEHTSAGSLLHRVARRGD
jgi:hypothetical protein